MDEEILNQYKQVRVLFSQLPEKAPRAETINKIIEFSNSYKLKPSFTFDIDRLVPRFTQWLATGWNWAPAAVAVFFVVAFLHVVSGKPPVSVSRAVNHPVDENFKALPFQNSADSEGVVGQVRKVAVPDMAEVSKAPEVSKNSLSVMPDNDLASSNLLTQIYPQQKKAKMEAQADDLLMRGRRLKALGRMDLALRDFETIFSYYPDYTYLGDVLMYRAQCYAFQGQFDKAIESLNLYIQKEPSRKTLLEPMIKQLKDSRAQALTDYQQ